MNAKEERALHLEINRATRNQTELVARNTGLEAECMRLRTALKHESDKHATNHAAMVKQCNAYQSAEREMFATMQRQRHEIMNQMQMETVAQRQASMDEVVIMKRNLDSRYADIINEKTKEFEEAKKKFEEECAERMVSENKAHTQREEEQFIHYLSRMEEVNQLKVETMRQFEEAKKKLEEECADRLASEKKAQARREEAQHAQYLSRMEEVKQMKIETMRQFEEAKKKLEEAQKKFDEECADRLASEKKERMRLEKEQLTQYLSLMHEAKQMKIETMRQLEDERAQLVKREQEQLAHCASCMEEIAQLKENLKRDRAALMQQANENNLQLVRERKDLIEFADNRFEAHVQSHTAELMKTVAFTQISHAVAANYAHTQFINRLDFNGKRILLYSHYSEHDEVESYNYLTLENMDERFDYVIVLTNCPNKWKLAHPNYHKYHFLSYNFKNDFRNYGVFIMQTARQLKAASQLCLMNDSFVIVDVSAFGRCVKQLCEPNTADFTGITSSYENAYHLQSYFMVFNENSVSAILDYFETHGLPTNHNAAILQYELGITAHLVKQGLVPFAMVSNNVPLNTTCCKWSAVLQHTGIVKRQHFLKQYPARFAMTDLNVALLANKFSQNAHFIHYLKYHGINVE